MVHLKSDKEIERLRASADLVGRTLGEVAALVRPGVSTAELDKVAEEFIRDHGAEPAFKGYRVGSLVFPGTLCTSVNDQVVHGIPDDRPLEEGDVLSADCGVLLDGFYGDSAYTFAVGDISDEVSALLSTTYESLMLGIAQATTGKRLGDIGSAIQTHCEGRGYGVVKDLVGHGIGRQLHEDPQVPNFGRTGSGRKLKTGLTVCIEPMINRGTASVRTEGDGWTVKTADSLPSAHYEHMIAVRPGEADVLTTFRYIEEALDVLPYELTTSVA
ncbi:MAG: type I methionyl aminopeptidase [Bacteroidetes bacterium]|nr:type I methionyl aminopeptidase [Bacteroidota bacterium]MDA1333574.1 type I methionyl aminopeptidase [Bacteroidota bacterium]